MSRRTRSRLRWPVVALMVLVVGFGVSTLHTGLVWRGSGGGYAQFGWGTMSVGRFDPMAWERFGWTFHRGGTPGMSFALESGPGGWALIVPLWAPAIALAIAAAALFRRPSAKGTCPKCGYDRAGLNMGAACPECGARPAE